MIIEKITKRVEFFTSVREGHDTFFNSSMTSLTKPRIRETMDSRKSRVGFISNIAATTPSRINLRILHQLKSGPPSRSNSLRYAFVRQQHKPLAPSQVGSKHLLPKPKLIKKPLSKPLSSLGVVKKL